MTKSEWPEEGTDWQRVITHRTENFHRVPVERRSKQYLHVTKVFPKDELGREIRGFVTSSKDTGDAKPYACSQIIFNAYWEPMNG
jgi:hypothetical protein